MLLITFLNALGRALMVTRADGHLSLRRKRTFVFQLASQFPDLQLAGPTHAPPPSQAHPGSRYGGHALHLWRFGSLLVLSGSSAGVECAQIWSGATGFTPGVLPVLVVICPPTAPQVMYLRGVVANREVSGDA
jgi:hypothetical protein